MCTVLLPQSVKPIAVNEYINIKDIRYRCTVNKEAKTFGPGVKPAVIKMSRYSPECPL